MEPLKTDLVPFSLPESEREELNRAFDEIQMFRTPFELASFVVGAYHTEEHQYAHCVLELSNAYDALRIAKLGMQKKFLEMEKLDRNDPIAALDYQIKEIEQEQLRRAMLGKFREFEALYQMWKLFPKKYTREDLNAASKDELVRRHITQARHDLKASGRISVSNREGLRVLGITDLSQVEAEQVERRYLEQGRCRVLIGIPTEKKAESGFPCLKGVFIPQWVEWRVFNNYSNKVADAYNFIVREALNDQADFLITVEDDTYPPPDAITRLIEMVRSENKKGKCAVGAWYPKREEPRQGVHIVLNGYNDRGPCPDDGKVHEVYTLAMGCSVYPTQMFREIEYPWFKTTGHLSQDSYFSQLARDAGWKLLVDTSLKCKHIDRTTGRVFE